MKNLLFVVLVAVGMIACNNVPSTGNFGEKITPDGAVSVSEFLAQMPGKTELSGKVKGTILKVCQSKGCWYTLEMPDGGSMRVVTKDHTYSLPKDASGKTAIASGRATITEISVEQQKHLAADEGKSPAEIAEITKPSFEIEFEADGVIIQ